MAVKPTVRVSAGSSKFLGDSYVNFASALGYGTPNLLSQSTYGYNPLSRNRYRLDMMYRGSWLVRQIVDSVAEDMTRAGITIESDMTPEDESELMEEWNALQLWTHLSSTLKWARLYGGAIGVIMLDGQDPEKPINVRAVQQGQFKGLFVLDRWMVQPSLEDTVKDLGPKFGLPRFYDVVSDAHSVPSMRLHHSRCIRLEGVDLPYWQKISENMWGISVIEPMFDRMTAFDSATAGAAQLVFKAHLRTLSVERLRELIAAGGKSYQAFLEQVGLIRQMQSNEGMTILDASDKFETHQYSFGGLSDLLMQFGQQLSGAAQIPLVRLFGQSPAGMNATGESDIRNYYDMINSQQEARLRQPLHLLLDILHRHKFGRPLPNGFGFSFRPLWQLQEEQKAQSAAATTQTVLSAYEASAIGLQTVLKELREQSKVTGVWTNITDEAIAAADEQPPDPMQMQGMPGAAGAMPGADPAAGQPGAPAPSLGQSGAMPAPQERTPRQSQAKQKVLALLRPQEDEAVNDGRLAKIHKLFDYRHGSKLDKIKAILMSDAFDPNEPRDPGGKWIEGAGSGAADKPISPFRIERKNGDELHINPPGRHVGRMLEKTAYGVARGVIVGQNFMFTPADIDHFVLEKELKPYVPQAEGHGFIMAPADHASFGDDLYNAHLVTYNGKQYIMGFTEQATGLVKPLGLRGYPPKGNGDVGNAPPKNPELLHDRRLNGAGKEIGQ